MITDLQMLDKRALLAFRSAADVSARATRAAFNLGDMVAWLTGPLYTSFDQSFDRNSKHYACKAECAHCCHDVIHGWPPELLLLGRMIRELTDIELRDETLSRLRQRVDEMAGITNRADYLRRQLPCIFLYKKTNTCSIYVARPLCCREHNSLKVSDCIVARTDPDFAVRVDKGPQMIAAGMIAGMTDALFERGLTMKAVEFYSGLLFVVENPDAEDRWLAGEDVFKGLPGPIRAHPPEPPKVKLW